MRIVSLAPSATELLYALGCGDDIVGVTWYCDYPIEAKTKPRVGRWIDIDFDKVEKLKPDVIFTSTFVQQKVVEECEKRGLHVVHTDPKTLDDVYESIKIIARAVGRESEGKKIVEDMKKEFSAIRAKAKLPLYVEEWHKPPMASGNWVSELIEIAGGMSILKRGEVSREVSFEEIILFNPRAIVLSWCGFGMTADPNAIKRRWNLAAPVFVINDSLLNRPGPRLVDGCKKLNAIANLINIVDKNSL